MDYEYKMAQLPSNIGGATGGDGEAAKALHSVVKSQAVNGWEFYRVDSFTTSRPTGCFGGGQPTVSGNNVVTFRRLRQ